MSEKKTVEDLKNVAVSRSVLAEMFGVGTRMIDHLEKQGIVEKLSYGKYNLIESAKSYINSIKIAKATTETPRESDDEDLDPKLEAAKHERVKRYIDEIKLQLIKGQVHKAVDVERVLIDIMERIKSKVTAIPSKLARKLEYKKKTDIQSILTREMDEVLKELATYNPHDFYSDEYIDIPDDAIDELVMGEKDD